MDWVLILGKISIWIIVVPLIIGFLSLSKFDKDSKLIFLIVFIGTIPQVLNPFLKNTDSLTLLYNLYTPFEFLIYWYLFYSNANANKFRNGNWIILTLFLVLSFYLLFNSNLLEEFITVWVVINNIFQLILVGICLLSFYESDEIDFDKKRPLFWFIIGIISYASCTVIFYSLWNYLKHNPDSIISNLNLIHHIFNILLYIFFTKGFIVNIENDKSKYRDE
jgi:hypothetical protein